MDQYKIVSECQTGETNSNAKLTEKEVKNILDNDLSIKEILDRYPIKIAQAYRIKKGKRWQYLRSVK